MEPIQQNSTLQILLQYAGQPNQHIAIEQNALSLKKKGSSGTNLAKVAEKISTLIAEENLDTLSDIDKGKIQNALKSLCAKIQNHHTEMSRTTFSKYGPEDQRSFFSRLLDAIFYSLARLFQKDRLKVIDHLNRVIEKLTFPSIATESFLAQVTPSSKDSENKHVVENCDPTPTETTEDRSQSTISATSELPTENFLAQVTPSSEDSENKHVVENCDPTPTETIEDRSQSTISATSELPLKEEIDPSFIQVDPSFIQDIQKIAEESYARNLDPSAIMDQDNYVALLRSFGYDLTEETFLPKKLAVNMMKGDIVALVNSKIYAYVLKECHGISSLQAFEKILKSFLQRSSLVSSRELQNCIAMHQEFVGNLYVARNHMTKELGFSSYLATKILNAPICLEHLDFPHTNSISSYIEIKMVEFVLNVKEFKEEEQQKIFELASVHFSEKCTIAQYNRFIFALEEQGLLSRDNLNALLSQIEL